MEIRGWLRWSMPEHGDGELESRHDLGRVDLIEALAEVVGLGVVGRVCLDSSLPVVDCQ